jgi:hypothetical protein
VKGETLGIYLEDEGEGEICMEQTYLMERKRIPQESARITRGEPWSLEVALESSKPVWEDRERIGTKGYERKLIWPGTRYVGYI